jgi:hypothetical protein
MTARPSGDGGVRPIAMATGRLVDERWAEIASAEEIETIKHALQSLLGKLQGEDGIMIGSREQAGS